MNSLKALLFDFGGTLDANGETWLERVSALAEQAGVRVAPEIFARAFYDADDNLPRKHELLHLNFEEVVTRLVRDLLTNLQLDAGLTPRIAAPFLRQARAALRESRSFLEELRPQFRLGIVSNNHGHLKSLLEREGWGRSFEVVVDSGNVGVKKPDPRIFQRALQSLHLKPQEAMVVGDSLRRDMQGAHAIGSPHAWLSGKQPAPPCCSEALVLRRLSDLREHLMLPSGST